MVGPPAVCLAALVRASWTMRYAARPTPGATGVSSPVVVSRTSSPASSAPVTRSAIWPRPGCGPRGCSSSSPTRCSRCRISLRPVLAVVSIERRLCAARCGIALEDAGRPAGLDRDHRQAVGDRVVQVARDPRALGLDRPAGLLLAPAVQLLGLLGDGPHLRPAPGHHQADGPQREHQDDRRQEVRRRVAAGAVGRRDGDPRDRHDVARRPPAGTARRPRPSRSPPGPPARAGRSPAARRPGPGPPSPRRSRPRRPGASVVVRTGAGW